MQDQAMKKEISEIQALTGQEVYVGVIPGGDGKTIYACVEYGGFNRCNPGETDQAAVTGLLVWINEILVAEKPVA